VSGCLDCSVMSRRAGNFKNDPGIWRDGKIGGSDLYHHHHTICYSGLGGSFHGEDFQEDRGYDSATLPISLNCFELLLMDWHRKTKDILPIAATRTGIITWIVSR
jgi:hypothetical protein